MPRKIPLDPKPLPDSRTVEAFDYSYASTKPATKRKTAFGLAAVAASGSIIFIVFRNQPKVESVPLEIGEQT